jgi:hypothetical protein
MSTINVSLIQPWLLESVDDDDLDRSAAGFQLQSELLLYRGEEVGGIGICRWLRRAGQPAEGIGR